MQNRTRMMEKILKSPEAQKIIDFVSPVYGEAYAGLSLFNAIGTALDELDVFPEWLKDQIALQTVSDEWALNYWEEQYKIYPEKDWDFETRRKNLMEKMGNHFYSPRKIENVLSAMTGYNVELKENTGKNKFDVLIRGFVKDLTNAKAFVDKVKPAHLVYDIKVSELIEANLQIYLGIGVSQHEHYEIEVQ